MTTSLTNQPENQRSAPSWLNAIIVLLVLFIGLWAVWYFAIRKPNTVELAAEEVVEGGGAGGRRGWAPPTSRQIASMNDRRGGGGGGGGGRAPMVAPNRDETIRRTNSGAIRARHNDVLLSASYSQAKGVADVDLNYSFDLMEKWVSAKEIQLHMLAWRASNITNTGTAVGLTEEQRKKLLALKYHLTVTPEELAKCAALLTAWIAAENNAAAREKASAVIVAMMAQIGKLHEAETKSLFQQRLLAIPTILTAAQLDKLRELQRAANQAGGAAPNPAPRMTPAIVAPTTKPTGPAMTLVPGVVPTTQPTTRPKP